MARISKNLHKPLMLVEERTISDLIKELEDRDILLSSFYDELSSKPAYSLSLLECTIKDKIVNFYGDKINLNSRG